MLKWQELRIFYLNCHNSAYNLIDRMRFIFLLREKSGEIRCIKKFVNVINATKFVSDSGLSLKIVSIQLSFKQVIFFLFCISLSLFKRQRTKFWEIKIQLVAVNSVKNNYSQLNTLMWWENIWERCRVKHSRANTSTALVTWVKWSLRTYSPYAPDTDRKQNFK